VTSVTQFELGWLAGIIDGEGSITVCKRGPTYVPTCLLYTSDAADDIL
jgi:hypothetical protein